MWEAVPLEDWLDFRRCPDISGPLAPTHRGELSAISIQPNSASALRATRRTVKTLTETTTGQQLTATATIVNRGKAKAPKTTVKKAKKIEKPEGESKE